MTQELPDRPPVGRRRPRPAADEKVDPIDSKPAAESEEPDVVVRPPQRLVREPFNARLDPQVIELLHAAKLARGIKLYEAVEQAVQAYWGSLARKKES